VQKERRLLSSDKTNEGKSSGEEEALCECEEGTLLLGKTPQVATPLPCSSPQGDLEATKQHSTGLCPSYPGRPELHPKDLEASQQSWPGESTHLGLLGPASSRCLEFPGEAGGECGQSWLLWLTETRALAPSVCLRVSAVSRRAAVSSQK
jgi:hypothetical protein